MIRNYVTISKKLRAGFGKLWQPVGDSGTGNKVPQLHARIEMTIKTSTLANLNRAYCSISTI